MEMAIWFVLHYLLQPELTNVLYKKKIITCNKNIEQEYFNKN